MPPPAAKGLLRAHPTPLRRRPIFHRKIETRGFSAGFSAKIRSYFAAASRTGDFRAGFGATELASMKSSTSGRMFNRQLFPAKMP